MGLGSHNGQSCQPASNLHSVLDSIDHRSTTCCHIWVQTRLVLAVSLWTRQSDSRAVWTGVDLLGQAAAVFKAVARGANNYANHYANTCDFARPPPLFLERKGANFPRFSDTGERV